MIVVDASWAIALAEPENSHHAIAASNCEGLSQTEMLIHPVTLAECLVIPARLGFVEDAEIQLRVAYNVPEVDRGAPARWAILRADTALKLPDAIVLDTALHHRASAIATFDSRLAVAARSHNLEVLGAP